MNDKTDIMENMQDNEDKQKVRDILLTSTSNFAKQTKPSRILYVGLPCIDWLYEKQLRTRCRIDNLGKPVIVGLENGHYPTGHEKEGQAVWPDMSANTPNCMEAEHMDFDKYIRNAIKNNILFNVIYGDFMCHAAEENGKNGKLRYTYPNIDTFVAYVEQFQHPFMYFMTFYCNGRINGGKNPMIKAMGGPKCEDAAQAIRSKVSCQLSQKKLTDKVTEVLRVSYRGGKRSNMVTIGFAVNFTPNFPCIKENWIEEKAVTIKEVKEVDRKVFVKDAIKALADLGWTSDKIALALSIKKGNVGATLAHYHNPDSFKGKGKGKKVKVKVTIDYATGEMSFKAKPIAA